ncbi:hypothetical protein ASF49_21395 [Methylobacterium sp. Leaf104]|uniref:hypothetical protein n=1 Tax=Methylobacterium TaxID=407 RepID=UPI0007016734|nr:MULTISPECIES: hypothetical protein [Methylobacterium]KQP40060.1 hypothetical protein ASF49_21395 [Methylobacterium sp. Leaf104]MCI9881943.1 hypothetical protein [Methylobacterium goesingense]
MRPASILVVVPTTGGPLILQTLKARPGLPMSAAFAAGDYRPLPWSGDYARLSAEGGPLSRLAGLDSGPYELRLSGSFEAGRSWEAPVCLAHGLLARGHALTPDPAEAEIVVWATGAVDLDLAILPGAYALVDKIERSRDLLARAGRAELVVLLPAGPEAAEAERTLRELGRSRPPVILPSGSVIAALAALAPPAVSAPVGRRVHRRALAAGLAGLAALVAVGLALAPLAVPRGAETSSAVTMNANVAPPAILAEELVAPAGSSCRRVAFGADPPERRPIPAEALGKLRASRLAPDLCGLAFRPGRTGARLAVDPTLAAATLPPTRLPDGAQAYFLREGARQNLVYAVQAIPDAGAAGSSERYEHALVR